MITCRTQGRGNLWGLPTYLPANAITSQLKTHFHPGQVFTIQSKITMMQQRRCKLYPRINIIIIIIYTLQGLMIQVALVSKVTGQHTNIKNYKYQCCLWQVFYCTVQFSIPNHEHQLNQWSLWTVQTTREYRACEWSENKLVDFVAVKVFPRLDNSNISTIYTSSVAAGQQLTPPIFVHKTAEYKKFA